ncbi:MAG TPA: AraC family transcriptional regulator [Firmicutes bacterium]|nr:AraC family transcriptional regulator [Bacillota bacterium]
MPAKSPVLVCRYADDPGPHHIHSHLSCELIYVRRGKALFTAGESRYTVGGGAVVVLSSLEDHSVTVLEEPYQRYFTMLSVAELEKQTGNPRLTAVFKNRPPGFRHVLTLPGGGERLEGIFAALLAEYSRPGAFSGELSAALIKELLILLCRANPAAFPSCAGPLYQKIEEAQRYLESHFTEPVSVAEIAGRAFLQADYFSRSFKEITGYTPKQYLTLLRLTYGCQLLLQSGLAVQDIAVRCGFGDASGFIQAFKKRYGATPHQYRRQEGAAGLITGGGEGPK